MSLSERELRGRLRHPFRYHARVDSSNEIAKAWLLQGRPDLAAVIADEQRSGRGRLGRSWHTPPGVALAVSVLLRPGAEWLPRVNMLGALSVCELAEDCGCGEIGIKWPNDVQAGGKKISGVLTDAVWRGEESLGAVLGLGVNVRNDFGGTALENTATTLEAAAGRRLNRAALLARLLERVEHWYRRVESDDLFNQWRARLNMLGETVNAEGVSGLALDVTPDGALRICVEDGSVREFGAGDIAVGTGRAG